MQRLRQHCIKIIKDEEKVEDCHKTPGRTFTAMTSALYTTSKTSPMPPANTDCYFYYYSSCAKGPSCPYRHEPAALAQEVVCTFWKQGKCTVSDLIEYTIKY